MKALLKWLTDLRMIVRLYKRDNDLIHQRIAELERIIRDHIRHETE